MPTEYKERSHTPTRFFRTLTVALALGVTVLISAPVASAQDDSASTHTWVHSLLDTVLDALGVPANADQASSNDSENPLPSMGYQIEPNG